MCIKLGDKYWWVFFFQQHPSWNCFCQPQCLIWSACCPTSALLPVLHHVHVRANDCGRWNIIETRKRLPLRLRPGCLRSQFHNNLRLALHASLQDYRHETWGRSSAEEIPGNTGRQIRCGGGKKDWRHWKLKTWLLRREEKKEDESGWKATFHYLRFAVSALTDSLWAAATDGHRNPAPGEAAATQRDTDMLLKHTYKHTHSGWQHVHCQRTTWLLKGNRRGYCGGAEGSGEGSEQRGVDRAGTQGDRVRLPWQPGPRWQRPNQWADSQIPGDSRETCVSPPRITGVQELLFIHYSKRKSWQESRWNISLAC